MNILIDIPGFKKVPLDDFRIDIEEYTNGGHKSNCSFAPASIVGLVAKIDELTTELQQEQKPVVDEQKRIKYLEESNAAMESVMTIIAGEFGTPIGDVFTLMGTIHVFKEQKKRWAEKIVSGHYFARECYYHCVFCGASDYYNVDEIDHNENCIVIEARQYLESLEGE